jgi:hypothetical protein
MPDNLHGKDEGLFLRTANSGCRGVMLTLVWGVIIFFVLGFLGMILQAIKGE